jgi:hypothetical protein
MMDGLDASHQKRRTAFFIRYDSHHRCDHSSTRLTSTTRGICHSEGREVIVVEVSGGVVSGTSSM